jgi:hypothetical protein
MGGKTQGGPKSCMVTWKERAVLGSEFRSGDPGKPTRYPTYISVGDFPRYRVADPKIGTNSRKTSTIIFR